MVAGTFFVAYIPFLPRCIHPLSKAGWVLKEQFYTRGGEHNENYDKDYNFTMLD